jgi:hypothetical protein
LQTQKVLQSEIVVLVSFVYPDVDVMVFFIADKLRLLKLSACSVTGDNNSVNKFTQKISRKQ